MPRAKRVAIPGGVWHLTHRCHSRQFLLKFQRDRNRWRHWLFEATKRYGLTVLNYIDFNMVRAGVVQHPAQWRVSGYHDIQIPPQRYRLMTKTRSA